MEKVKERMEDGEREEKRDGKYKRDERRMKIAMKAKKKRTHFE